MWFMHSFSQPTLNRLAAFLLCTGLALAAPTVDAIQLPPGGGGTTPPPTPPSACPVYMVLVGPICVDKYEASVWSMRPKSNGTPQGVQYGVDVDDYPCSDYGATCTAPANPAISSSTAIFAASVPGVMPSASITWFQAQEACANVGKRLLRNGEWQTAATGTPQEMRALNDPNYKCNHGDPAVGSQQTFDLEPTGSRSTCISNRGMFDMIGNVEEWVEDWSSYLDEQYQIREDTAYVRGGSSTHQGSLGRPSFALLEYDEDKGLGFRCAK